MTNITTNFVAQSRQSLTAAPGTAMRGLSGGLALRGERAIACGAFTGAGSVWSEGALQGTRIGEGIQGGLGGFGLRPGAQVILAAKSESHGSGVSTGNESARDRGALTADHVEETPRRYGASGECSRRNPAW
ncbi:hypothetical protein [Nocardiopsis lambiniae]|uniref:Uncharacterized protein n=1 Tax=Nocardiopsis lambiniae TaxID=3075539 RepID=A0ABU2MFX2_9ACTN|nr:hypothetical protein [Nocardiopsis sp. DSM 44743]MDT0331591.1 hypothetical protein [Nocardiopsis sp. DSM 44743]